MLLSGLENYSLSNYRPAQGRAFRLRLIMITAEQARLITGFTVLEKVEKLDLVIQQLASEKKRQLRTGYDHSEDEDLWKDGGYHTTEEWKEAKAILEELGYKVSFYYKEGAFAVDMYTLIEW